MLIHVPIQQIPLYMYMYVNVHCTYTYNTVSLPDDYDDGLTSQSTANVDETPKPEKAVTVTRHKSLHAPSDRQSLKPLATDLVTVCREMQVTLLERCAKAGRPHDLNVS